jgi:hypothetical protein
MHTTLLKKHISISRAQRQCIQLLLGFGSYRAK